MPIIEPAPWRHQYFEHVTCPDDVIVPADDPEAWELHPRHRWVFDKLAVALSQGMVAGPHGLSPPSFPVFSKPIMNFKGMGIGSRVIRSAAEMTATYEAGHMWMPVLAGEHVSTDMAVVDGHIAWMRHATGMPTEQGMFDHWQVHAQAMPELAASLAAWVGSNLAGYTGMLNVETIGTGIIEAHLRFSDQWPDLYGPGWVEALVGLYRDRAWRFAEDERRDGFSVALFMPHGQRFRHPPRALVEDVLATAGVSSVQITFHETKPPEQHGNPPGGFRVALVNAFSRAAGERGRAMLRAWFEGEGQVMG